MKIFNNNKKNRAILALLMITSLFSGCSDYLDVDRDTDDPTVASLNYLLTNTQTSIALVGDFNNFTGGLISTYTHQMTSREEEDQYGLKVGNINVNNDWEAIYLALNDIETLIRQGTETGNLVYVGIAQMQKAYIMSYAVDLWGDVPYSETIQLTNGIIAPKFDNQREIYNSIFSLITTAKANLASNAGLKKPGNDDLIYKGNISKWIKFANTFKLKLYNQTRLVADFDQAGFDALVAENNFFTSNIDDFQFPRFNVISPTNERNQLFIEAYEGTQFGSYQSPWMYEILKGMNPNIHTSNPDPRIPYYYYNQLTPGQLPPDQGDATTGNPKADYWDRSTGFFTIRFGSTGPYRDASAENSYTYPGIFPAGGRYDDGLGGSVATLGPNSGTGAAPHRVLTYDEFLYIQAELMHVGKLPGDTSAKLREAMTASFAKVDQVVTIAKGSTQSAIPVLTGSPAVTTFIDNVIAEFTAASPDKQLEIIMTQKWVATFGDPMDQYTDYRRTGYPILANPLSTTPEYQLNNGDAFPLIDSQTVLNNPFQLSLFWPQNELNTNANAPAQKNPGTYKIFWDN
ncbi:MAG TPA: SusD/RagB family nutrient-binding outer membrane lipoprotein [Flavobacterium sp.]|jgi:hypothetical protein